jgi:3-phenylpropionate/trans-cinnamate dioxygenase ferredoxin subunit
MVTYRSVDPEACEFVAIAAETDLANGERLFIEIDGLPIVLFNIAGQLFAIADVCSHDDGPLGDGDLEGYEITCPRHGASFDVRNGEVISLPAIVNIPSYPVRIVAGEIEIGVPKEGK